MSVPVKCSLQWGHGPKAVETYFRHKYVRAKWQLQWGHGPKAVETLLWETLFPYVGLLQWGHGPKAVETSWRTARRTLPSACFNGATARRPWRQGDTGLMYVCM